jgi:hypothetical protein
MNSPFDEVETLLQCIFPLERRIAPAEGARFSGSFAKKTCTRTRPIGLESLGIQGFWLCSVRIKIICLNLPRDNTF